MDTNNNNNTPKNEDNELRKKLFSLIEESLWKEVIGPSDPNDIRIAGIEDLVDELEHLFKQKQ